MNTEYEKKYSISNKRLIKNRLIEIGARSLGTKSSEDIYFKVPEKTPRTHYLRLRTNKGNSANCTLAYHEVVNDLETREWETNVENLRVMKEIINKLGFDVDVVVSKNRETFELGESEIVVDEVKNLGNFIEIESPSKNEIDQIADKLKINDQDIVSGLGYPDLLKQKNY